MSGTAGTEHLSILIIRDLARGLVPTVLASLCMGSGDTDGAVPGLSHSMLCAG